MDDVKLKIELINGKMVFLIDGNPGDLIPLLIRVMNESNDFTTTMYAAALLHMDEKGHDPVKIFDVIKASYKTFKLQSKTNPKNN